jgi:hypothetical protein
MKFTGELQATGGSTTGFRITDAFVDGLGGGGRPKVVVTVDGFTFRSSIARMGGAYWLGVSAERRAAGDLRAGEVYDLEIGLDTAPREIEVPADLAAALDAAPAAREFWGTVSASNRRWHVEQVTGARKAETRAARVAKSIAMLSEGRAR